MNNGFYKFSRGKQEASSSVFPYTGSAIITGSLEITGSLQVLGTTTINNTLILTPTSKPPGTLAEGMIIVSGSGADRHIYCYLNSGWTQLDNGK